MALGKLEREILTALKQETGNPKLKEADLLEWSSAPIKLREGIEATYHLQELGVYAAVPRKQVRKDTTRPAAPGFGGARVICAYCQGWAKTNPKDSPLAGWAVLTFKSGPGVPVCPECLPLGAK